jgi:hypothetical protein
MVAGHGDILQAVHNSDDPLLDHADDAEARTWLGEA